MSLKNAQLSPNKWILVDTGLVHLTLTAGTEPLNVGAPLMWNVNHCMDQKEKLDFYVQVTGHHDKFL